VDIATRKLTYEFKLQKAVYVVSMLKALRDIAMEANCSLIEFENNLYEEIEH